MSSSQEPSVAPRGAAKLHAALLIAIGLVGGALLTVGVGRLLLPFDIGWFGLLLPVVGTVAVAAALWRIGRRPRLIAAGMAGGSVLLVAHGMVLVALFY